jgi:exonuclease VII large subunit
MQQFKELDDAKNEGASQGEQLLDRLESEYKKKNYERSKLEQQLKEVQDDLRIETKNNLELKEQMQEKEMKDKSNQDRIRTRIAQQEKLIAKLKEDLDGLTENIVRSIVIH